MDKLFLAAIKEETIGLDYFNHVGVGKINATYNTLKLINIYKPKLIINYGTAGAINIFDLGGTDNLFKKGYKVANLMDFPGH